MRALTALAPQDHATLAASAPGTLLAIPLGATEQHGPHLPLGTDTIIADALARGLARRRPAVVVAPTVPYGSSGEHHGFVGTLSVGQTVIEHLVVELVRSADAFAGVVLVCAHGGNAEPVARAVRTLAHEGRRVLAWATSFATIEVARLAGAPGPPDAHAGWVETSLMLALAPELVELKVARAGNGRPLRELAAALRSGGVRSVSRNGVLGDPAGASAALGWSILDGWIADLSDAVDRRWPPSDESADPSWTG